MTDIPPSTRHIIPALTPLYDRLAPIAETLMRVAAGVAFMVHGWPKIQDPLGRIEMVQGIGFYPGWFWATALAVTEFIGGLLLILGLLTRPVAAATTFVLLVTTWFHWIKLEQGYSGAELSILWATITLYFVTHGAGRYSLDRLLGREF